jgi:hypothetical protein
MAKADPPKKDKPKYGTAAATGAGYGVMSGAKKAKAGFKPYNTETSFYKNKVPRTFKYIDNEGRTAKAFADDAMQRVTKTKTYSKLGVKTTSTLTETVQGMRQSTRSTTLSPRGKLKGLGQVVIQETKALEAAGKGYLPEKGPVKKQGGKGGGKGKYTTKSITYAKEGYPTPKRGRVPKAGNPVVSSLTRQTQLGNIINFTRTNVGGDVSTTAIVDTKTKNIYKTLVAPQTRAGQYIQSKSAAQLFSAASGAAKVAGKIIGAGNIVGTAVLAYDVMKWANKWHEDNPNANKEKYKNYSFNK